MARFDHLELGGSSPEKKNRQQAETPAAEESRPRARHDANHWLKQADLNRRVGHCENALRFYSRALEENKTLIVAWVGQVQMLVQLDEAPEADLWARKALEIFAGNGELLAARAQALCRQGKKKEAMAVCDGSLSAEGKSAYRWQVRGELMMATRQSTDVHCFDMAQQMDRDWLVPLETALIALHYKQPTIAQARARIAAEAAPDQAYCWYTYGRAQQALGFDTKAKESYEHCLKLSPNHADALARLGELGGGSIARRLRSLFRRS